MGERNESAEQETWQEAKCSKAIRQKKAERKNKEQRETGICCHQKTCNNKQCKIRDSKMGGKNN